MRARGLTLLETLIATAVLAVLVVGASNLMFLGQTSYARGTSEAHVRQQAQRALEVAVAELRGAAAWTFGTVSGSTVTELTRWDEAQKKLVFDFGGPRPNVLFLRVVQGGVVQDSAPPYVVFDFEPLGTGGPFEDVNLNGTDLAGRMDDDRWKARVLLRTRSVGGRITLERVLAPAADAATFPGVPEVVTALADLGPDRLPNGATPGYVELRSPRAAVVTVKVVAKGIVDLKGKRPVVTTSELSADVALAASAPPR